MSENFIVPGKNSLDLTGRIFSRLTVVGPVERTSNGRIVWLCNCSCGNTTKVYTSNLTLKKVMSCGCLAIERIGQLNKTHGLTRTKIYRTWVGIIDRCCNPKSVSYRYYGAVGIELHTDWKNSFINFHSYVSSLPFFEFEKYTLDRIDNSKGYLPGNVQWSSAKRQARNKSNNLNIAYQGKIQPLISWSEQLEIPYHVLYMRLRRGWSAEKTFSTPYKK